MAERKPGDDGEPGSPGMLQGQLGQGRGFLHFFGGETVPELPEQKAAQALEDTGQAQAG